MSGPIIIFDKSTLQGLNPDEACWLENFYTANITPLFFVETLADLTKEVAAGRTPEQVVGNIAEKTPPSGRPNMHHRELCVANLLGQSLEMSRVPIFRKGRQVKTGKQQGIIFGYPPERQALQRWENHDFLDVEYRFASEWRQMLSNIDFDKTDKWLRPLLDGKVNPKNLKEAKALSDVLINDENKSLYAIRAICNFQDIPLFL